MDIRTDICSHCGKESILKFSCNICKKNIFCSKKCRNLGFTKHDLECPTKPRCLCTECFDPDKVASTCPKCRRVSFCDKCLPKYQESHQIVCGTGGMTEADFGKILDKVMLMPLEEEKDEIMRERIAETMCQLDQYGCIVNVTLNKDIDDITLANIQLEIFDASELRTKTKCWKCVEKYLDASGKLKENYRILVPILRIYRNSQLIKEFPVTIEF